MHSWSYRNFCISTLSRWYFCSSPSSKVSSLFLWFKIRIFIFSWPCPVGCLSYFYFYDDLNSKRQLLKPDPSGLFKPVMQGRRKGERRGGGSSDPRAFEGENMCWPITPSPPPWFQRPCNEFTFFSVQI